MAADGVGNFTVNIHIAERRGIIEPAFEPPASVERLPLVAHPRSEQGSPPPYPRYPEQETKRRRHSPGGAKEPQEHDLGDNKIQYPNEEREPQFPIDDLRPFLPRSVSVSSESLKKDVELINANGVIASECAKSFKAFKLEEKAMILINSDKHKDAVHVLLELSSITARENDHARLKNSLMLVECYLHLRRGVEEQIAEVEQLLMTSSTPNENDVKEMINFYIEHSYFLRALILIRCVCGVDANRDFPLEAACDIGKCMDNVLRIVREMKNDQKRLQLAGSLAVPSLKYMYARFRNLSFTDCDKKALEEVLCASKLGAVYFLLGEYKNQKLTCENGVRLMEERFGSNARQHAQFGLLLRDIAVACKREGNTKEAGKYFRAAIAAFECAIDFENEEYKKKTIGETRRWLQTIRSS